MLCMRLCSIGKIMCTGYCCAASLLFQVLVRAVVNAGPREDSTRIGSAGVVRRQVCEHCSSVGKGSVRHSCLRGLAAAAQAASLHSCGHCLPGCAANLLHALLPCFAPLYYLQAVDVSPFRRANQAMYLMSIGARDASFRTIKTIAECLADEIINASKGSSNSYAIKKKDEIERVAKANR